MWQQAAVTRELEIHVPFLDGDGTPAGMRVMRSAAINAQE